MPDEDGAKNGDPKTDVKGDGEKPAGDQDTKQPAGAFTQEQVDQIVTARLSRERQKYEDYDDLKANATKWDEHLETQKSEQQKIEDARDKALSERDTALGQVKEMALRSAVMTAAATHDAAHPEDAYRLIDMSKVTLGDDGKVDGAEAAVKELVKEGRLPTKSKVKAPNLDGGAGGKDRQGKDSITVEDIEGLAAAYGVDPVHLAKVSGLEIDK